MARAARQAVCEHPEGSVCTAKRDTGRIVCQCLDGEYETRDPELSMADDDGLMDACWEAWRNSCAPWTAAEASCDEPDVGECDVDDEGEVACSCDNGDELDEVDEALEGLDAEALEDACPEQLERLCGPSPAPSMGPPAEVAPEAEPDASCSVDPRGRTGSAWWLGLLLVAGGGRKKARRRDR
ncbi:MAG: hypothetical protein AB1Z98_18225 [Nannocystaceae bacterium]